MAESYGDAPESVHLMSLTLARPRPVAFLLLTASAAIVWTAHPPRGTGSAAAGMSARTAVVPTLLGSWTGTPLAIGDRVVDVLETDDVSLMEYRQHGGPPVWLALVAGFGNRAAFHPPEICYVGSHFEVLERGRVQVTAGGVPRQLMRLVIAQGGQRYEAWYWFTVGHRATPSYYRQQWWLLLDAVRGHPSSGTLVRISTPLENASAARQRLLKFVTAWEAQSPHG